MKTNRPPKIALAAVALAALSFTSIASAQDKPLRDDGTAASPKVRQMRKEQKASATPAVAAVPAMACPKCAEVLTTEVNHQAKDGQVLAGTATRKVAKHTCAACEINWTAVGTGKGKHSVTAHKCSADVPNNLACCASIDARRFALAAQIKPNARICRAVAI